MTVRRLQLNRILMLGVALLGATAAAAGDATAISRQFERIQQDVGRMRPRIAGSVNTFFVGFAGYGEQRVFRSEAELARRVFTERYGASGHALELVNDVRDRGTYALADLENLRYALKLIARRMDLNEDVLVLVLTSHGSPEDGIAVTNGELLDDDLSPDDLRGALDDAGIRWRIVVGSACYAGIFIGPLSTPTTLIMTAADARHSSFGCADDRELTYFGEALLADALPVACSLEGAFENARDLIRRRETDEGEIHSNPQIYIGGEMRAKLRGLEAASAGHCAAGGGGH